MKCYQKVSLAAHALCVAGSLVFCAFSASADTVAYWRFEEGPADANVSHGGVGDGVFYPGVADASGNGNALSVWAEGWAGFAYRGDVGSLTVPLTGDPNQYSVQNSGSFPAMFTDSEVMRTMTPSQFTIEVSFKPETGGYRTLVGRDSQGAAAIDLNLAALYLQIIPGDAVAIKFADVSGVWHEAISAAGAITGFPYPNAEQGTWYNMAAVSDGTLLSLYLGTAAAGGYSLVAQTDMTGASANTALTAGLGSGGDWTAGNWSVGRGLYAGGHGDRAYGFIDEVRISDVALDPAQLLYVPEPGTWALALLGAGVLALAGRRNRAGR
ncbi:MAG: PEP-CTERM sorting domain-containing protein [Verrucomicrobia bacterium]|nr:PEP-CTERM sorting domain-containing protein [Verrucomicrobiota bacterium]